MKHIVDIYSDEPFKGFWDRLKMFVSNVEVQDPMSEEEKDMIIAVCDGKREDGTDDIHRMGEAYSKEFLGDAYKKDGLREMAIEFGYVEGFLVAKRLPL